MIQCFQIIFKTDSCFPRAEDMIRKCTKINSKCGPVESAGIPPVTVRVQTHSRLVQGQENRLKISKN